MKKSLKLKNLILSPKLSFLMEAHNALSAKIVEETGFEGIWASGLSMSAALGVRDNNEASWTQILEVVEFMSDATNIPILLDGDTGYGNFNNMRRLVKKLESRGVAGVCIEDKLFPKTNSFLGESQPLADIDEFSGKIKAALDAKNDEDFVIVARVEAFIAGLGLKEALRRADNYHQAGAHAILIHSKKSDSSEIDLFMKEWANRSPVVIVPTKYYSVPTEHFSEIGVSTIIWANHNVRSSILAMQKTSKHIFQKQSLLEIESQVVSVSEIFRLQGADELEEAEKKYLPSVDQKSNAIILAASQGQELGELTKDVPKTLLKINGKTLLETQVEHFRRIGVQDITVVAGFAENQIKLPGIKKLINHEHQHTLDLYSLIKAIKEIKDFTIISFGDILYNSYILGEVFHDPHEITVFIDPDWKKVSGKPMFVQTTATYSQTHFLNPIFVADINTQMEEEKINGVFMGIWRVKRLGAQIVLEVLRELAIRADVDTLTHLDLFWALLKRTTIGVRFYRGEWLDVNTFIDLQRAQDLYPQ